MKIKQLKDKLSPGNTIHNPFIYFSTVMGILVMVQYGITLRFRPMVPQAAFIWMSSLTVLMLVSIGGAFWYFRRSVAKPLGEALTVVKTIEQGRLIDHIRYHGKDELGQILGSLGVLNGRMHKLTTFMQRISEGDFRADFIADDEHDTISQSVAIMRRNLANTIAEVRIILDDAGEYGDMETRVEIAGKSGEWLLLTESLNGLLDAITTPIHTITRIVNGMALGDLSQRYSENAKGDIYLLAQDLNKALDSLSELINQIHAGARTIEQYVEEMRVTALEMSTNTSEIASSISQMSSGAQTQVIKVDESSGLIERVLSSARDMREKSEAINEAAKKGVENSERGKTMVNKVVKNISSISDYSQRTTDSMRKLSERNKEISKVLSVITDIASQTNLLALNAAIEAAQAGDAGRGFAVVAEEIRKLAEESKNSAKEIEQLINVVQTDTSSAVSVIETMNSSVKSGVEASNEAADVFNEIAASSASTLSYSEEIVTASKGQTDSLAKVVQITESIVVIAEQTAAGTEEMASSATELSAGMRNYTEKSDRLVELAGELKQSAGKFTLREELLLSEAD